MAAAKNAPYPGKFKVTNTGKRARTRNGVRFPGVSGDAKPETVEVTVNTRAQYLRLKGCKDLQVAKGSGGGSQDG